MKAPPKSNNSAPFRCSFRASGKGYVIMERWRNSDDAVAQGYHYTRDGVWPAVSALTPRERREWQHAIGEEWGVTGKGRRA